MRAVWTTARAAARRRRVQTGVIAVVVMFSSAAAVVALGLLQAASAPFDHTFAAQRGAQITATFDPAAVSDARLALTADKPVIQAAAGPFAEAVVDVPQQGGGPNQLLTVVGRADPQGPVDRVDLWAGQWAASPGQIVLERAPGRGGFARNVLGTRIDVPGAPPLTVVGLASSLSQTADAWVAPDQIAALHPTATQMLYRFNQAATAAQVQADLAAVTAGLPPHALLASQSYLTIKQNVDATAGAYVPFLAGFALLGLAVAVLIVANVVVGAVLIRLREIGLLKAVGFTPNQVVAIFLAMIVQPALIGCVLGTMLGDAAALILLPTVFTGTGSGLTATLDPWVDVMTLAGMPAMVLLTALVPTRRARCLSAVEALRAASAPSSTRAPGVRRHLARFEFPRSVSLRLGLALPIARPARSVLTAAAVVLGVGTVTLAAGLSATMSRYGHAAEGDGAVQTIVYRGDLTAGQVTPRHSDTAAQALLSALPKAEQVTAVAYLNIRILGSPQTVTLTALRGRPAAIGLQLVSGRWATGPGQADVPSPTLHSLGLAVGERLTLDLGDRQTQVTIVGETMNGLAGTDPLFATWPTALALDSSLQAGQYLVHLGPGADVAAFDSAVTAADPGLYPTAQPATDAIAGTIAATAALLALLVAVVAALGVFNTVVLTARERRRDVGILKALGMTPNHVTLMMVTSTVLPALAGALLGIPLGMVLHRLVVPAMARAANIDFPPSMLDVWHATTLVLLALAGIAIAAFGAFVPARTAARLTASAALHAE